MTFPAATLRRLLCAFVLLVPLALPAADYYPSSTRFGLYSANVYQGVPGGIPARTGSLVYAASYGFDASASAATNRQAILDAVAASSSGDAIILPAGTFDVNGFTLSYNFNGRTLRGAGKAATVLNVTGDVIFGAGTDTGSPSNPKTRIVTATRGSTTITVEDGTMPNGYDSPGGGSYTGQRMMASVALLNENVTPVFGIYGNNPNIFTFPVILNGRSGNNLTLTQPLPSDFAASLAAGHAYLEWVHQSLILTKDAGFEDMTINRVDSGYAVFRASLSESCWIKNVKMSGYVAYAFDVAQVFGMEVTGCEVLNVAPGGGTNTSGAIFQNCTNLLIENCHFDGSPGIEFFGGVCNSVFAYNYLGVFNANHAPGAQFNLFEGNSWWYFTSDGYFGPSIYDTLFRNFAQSGISASLKRFTRGTNYIGNVVKLAGDVATDYTERWGDPNIGNESSSGTAQFSTGSYWADWDSVAGGPLTLPGTLTTRTSNTSGVITLTNSGDGARLQAAITANGNGVRGGFTVLFLTVTNITGEVVTFDTASTNLPAEGSTGNITPAPPAFQQFDLDVSGTAIKKANWYGIHGNIPSGEALTGGDTLPVSYFRATKPAYFGDRPWPPFDSANPGTPSATTYQNIPAGYRYAFASDPPPDGTVATPGFSPAGTQYSSAQTVTLLCGTAGATMYYTLGTPGSPPADPTTGSTVYTTALSVSTNTVIKAIAVKSGLTDSEVGTATYTFGSVPAAPSSLSATTASSSQINLTWTDNASDETGFYVLKSTTSNAETLHATIGTPNTTSYAVTGLTAATTYYFKVEAYNDLGYSPASNEASATTSGGGGGATDIGTLTVGTVNAVNVIKR